MNDADMKAFEAWCEKEYGFTTGLMQDEARAGWQAACEWRDSQVGEVFGYFKCNPDCWVDCAKTDEGAIALYEAPPTAQINQRLAALLEKSLRWLDGLCDAGPLGQQYPSDELTQFLDDIKSALAATQMREDA